MMSPLYNTRMCPVIAMKTKYSRCTDSDGGAGGGVGARREQGGDSGAHWRGGGSCGPRFRWHPGVRGVAGGMLQLLPYGSACWGDLGLAG